jgi:hypothetical protein
MKFKKDDKHPEVHICYTYVFNVEKNFPPGSKLPCNLNWKDVDIVLSIPNKEEMLDTYIPNTGGTPANLRNLKVIFVERIYEALLEYQLQHAYSKNHFGVPTSSDFRAKFRECGQNVSDVHYRMPGIPDFAVKIWLSMIATGLNEGYKTLNGIKYWE